MPCASLHIDPSLPSPTEPLASLAVTHTLPHTCASTTGKYEVATVFSVTKWVHLNWGDAGLKRLFHRLFRCLAPGGVLVLEPQPWRSYHAAVHKRDTSAVPFRRYSELLKLRPEAFEAYLTGEVGFELVARLRAAGEGEGGGGAAGGSGGAGQQQQQQQGQGQQEGRQQQGQGHQEGQQQAPAAAAGGAGQGAAGGAADAAASDGGADGAGGGDDDLESLYTSLNSSGGARPRRPQPQQSGSTATGRPPRAPRAAPNAPPQQQQGRQAQQQQQQAEAAVTSGKPPAKPNGFSVRPILVFRKPL